MDGASPTARALLALELIQASPGISGDRLGEKLGVSDRAARRYVATLRDAGIPIESTPGRYGGYSVGRGFRVPPLMFSTAEALGLVMAVIEGGHRAAAADDPAGSALSKIIRVLPAPVAEPVHAIRHVSARDSDAGSTDPSPETTAMLVQASAAARRVRIGYRTGPARERAMDVDPWAVVVRNARWYLLCWSHTSDATRTLRVDRVSTVEVLPETFVAPVDLDPSRAVDELMAQGWRYQAEVIIDAPVAAVSGWISRSLGRLEPIDETHTRLVGSTDVPAWYAAHLLEIEAPFHIVGSDELIAATAVLGRRLTQAAPDRAPPGSQPRGIGR